MPVGSFDGSSLVDYYLACQTHSQAFLSSYQQIYFGSALLSCLVVLWGSIFWIIKQESAGSVQASGSLAVVLGRSRWNTLCSSKGTRKQWLVKPISFSCCVCKRTDPHSFHSRAAAPSSTASDCRHFGVGLTDKKTEEEVRRENWAGWVHLRPVVWLLSFVPIWASRNQRSHQKKCWVAVWAIVT